MDKWKKLYRMIVKIRGFVSAWTTQLVSSLIVGHWTQRFNLIYIFSDSIDENIDSACGVYGDSKLRIVSLSVICLKPKETRMMTQNIKCETEPWNPGSEGQFKVVLLVYNSVLALDFAKSTWCSAIILPFHILPFYLEIFGFFYTKKGGRQFVCWFLKWRW